MADYLKTRFLEVISQLLREDGYVTLQSLADKMGVSKRTMQHDVDRVEEWLEENSLTDKVILSKGAWTTILFRYQELDAETGEYGPDKYAIRRYQKSGGEYRQKSKFNISSAEQARKIVDALSGWLADA